MEGKGRHMVSESFRRGRAGQGPQSPRETSELLLYSTPTDLASWDQARDGKCTCFPKEFWSLLWRYFCSIKKKRQ